MIYSIRNKLNISRYRLAELSGIDQCTLWRYEKRKNKPGADNLIKIATALNVTVDELLK